MVCGNCYRRRLCASWNWLSSIPAFAEFIVVSHSLAGTLLQKPPSALPVPLAEIIARYSVTRPQYGH